MRSSMQNTQNVLPQINKPIMRLRWDVFKLHEGFLIVWDKTVWKILVKYEDLVHAIIPKINYKDTVSKMIKNIRW